MDGSEGKVDSEDESGKEVECMDENAGKDGYGRVKKVAEEEDTSADGIEREEESSRDSSVVNDNTYLVSCSNEKLRYLVHNSSPEGIRFLLAFMKKHYSLPAFFRSQLCRVFFPKTTLLTLKDIYINQQHLTSYYRMLRFYPYPDNAMINNCLACNFTEQGQCTCPVLPEEFYLYCKGTCPTTFHCMKCEGEKHRGSHKCLDFYRCERCNDEYQAFCRQQPYPQYSHERSYLSTL